MQGIQSLLQRLVFSINKPYKTSAHPTTPQMPCSPTLTTVENVDQLIQPMVAITETVQAIKLPKYHPSHIEESAQCLPDQTVNRESSLVCSPAKKRLKINDDNFPQINQTETLTILLDTIGKCISLLILWKEQKHLQINSLSS